MFKKIIPLIVCLAIMFSLILTACSSAEKATAPATRTVTAQSGKTVVVPNVVKRVAVAQGACNIPEMLCAIGSGDTLVDGLCSAIPLQLKIQPQYASISKFLPDANGAANIEQLLADKIDVLFVWTNVKNIDQIQAAGIPVVQIDVSSWDTTLDMFRVLGQVMGKEKKSQEIIDYWNAMATRIQKKVAGLTDAQKKKVLFLSSGKPLTAMGSDSHNRYMIEKAGGINLTNDMVGHYVEISVETMYKLDPDVVLIQGGQQAIADTMSTDSSWAQLRALKQKTYYVSPTGAFLWDKPGAETPLYLLWEAHKFYPDMFTRSDVEQETKSFFTKFFNYTLTDSELNTMLGAE